MNQRPRYRIIPDSQPRLPRFWLLGLTVGALTALLVFWAFVILLLI